MTSGMPSKFRLDLISSLTVAVGILLATFTSARAAESRWLVLGGPLLLALAIVGADMLTSRLRGTPCAPSWAALILAGSLVLAGVIVDFGDPGLVKTVIPISGMGGWVALQAGREGLRRPCWGS